MSIDQKKAIENALECLAIEGPSGKESRISNHIIAKLKKAGCKSPWISIDDADKKIGEGFETGNLIIKFPGTIPGKRKLFMCHMDTVPICVGSRPVIKGNKIVSKNKTGVGADDRAAVACLITVIEKILKESIPHQPLTFLFTVGEEIGLLGAKQVSLKDLGNPELGFNIDSSNPEELLIGAIGMQGWEAHITGISAHAGVQPENGVSAILIASKAIAEVKKKGYFGKVKGNKGLSNPGIIGGGKATNEVTDYVYVKGESRSHDKKNLHEITQAYEDAFRKAAKSVTNEKGVAGKVDFVRLYSFDAFKIPLHHPIIAYTKIKAKKAGISMTYKVTNGGLDANYMNAKGLPTVTLGVGQLNPHSLNDYLDIKCYLKTCKLVLALVQE